MAATILSREAFKASDADEADLRQYMGLCGDEPVSIYLEAGVDHVERLTQMSLRKLKVHYTTRGGDVTLPYGPIDRVESVSVVSQHGVRMGMFSHDGRNQDYYGRYKIQVNGKEKHICLPMLETECGPTECAHYEVIYHTKAGDVSPLVRMATFMVAKSFYDAEPMPDLSHILHGIMPSKLERFANAVGGLNIKVL